MGVKCKKIISLKTKKNDSNHRQITLKDMSQQCMKNPVLEKVRMQTLGFSRMDPKQKNKIT